MSLSTWKGTIEDGGLCIIYEGIDRVQHFVAKKGDILNNRFGAFYHDDLIGRPYGLKWVSRTPGQGKRRRRGPPEPDAPKGFVYVLHPTPELWTYALPHRTQIIYTPDISYITLQLDLKPGAVVIETGTGSGSLTCALARTVLPTGHVHTFEYHAERAQRARDDFAMLGLDHVVTVELRDTMANGFPAELEGKADAVFLDLPGPWETISSAHASLKEGGSICGFSPCIEQVQRTCEALRETGFHEVRTVEIRFTNYESKTMTTNIPDFGEVPVQVGTGAAEAASSGAASDVQPEAKLAGSTGQKRHREDEDGDEQEQTVGADNGTSTGSDTAAAVSISPGADAPHGHEVVKMVGSRTLPGMSHSSYLTFAMKVTTADKVTIPAHMLETAEAQRPGARATEPWLRVGEAVDPGSDGAGIVSGSAEEQSVIDLLSERDEAKRMKAYEAADAARDKLHGLGVHFNDRERTWCHGPNRPGGRTDPGPRSAAGDGSAAQKLGSGSTPTLLNLMVRSDSEVPVFGAKLVQIESQAASSLEGLAGALREKLGLASTAQLRVKTSGEELTETSLEQLRSKGRGQLQVAVSDGAAAQ